MIGKRKTMERNCLSAFSPPFTLHTPQNDRRTALSAVVFAAPHSGSHYPASFVEMSELSEAELARNEDVWIDKLFSACVHEGATLIRANFPRSFLDVNRAADELTYALSGKRPEDARPLTPRAQVGLGVIPTLIAENMPIYKKAPKPAEVNARIEALYHPYHAALKNLVKTAKAAHGHCLLVDCHSMPGFAPMGARRSDIIIGDRHGQSCAPETAAFVERLFKVRGYSVTRNHPYAGGYVTQHYADLENAVETLQIEINRDLYVNPVTRKEKPGYRRLQADLADIVSEIIESRRHSYRLAAE